MHYRLFLFSALLCGGILSSCSSDQQLSETNVSSIQQDENVLIVENPYAISEDEITKAALSFFDDIKATLRSGNSESNADKTPIVRAKDYYVKDIGRSREEEKDVKQKVPVYTINYKNNLGENAGAVVMAGDERLSNNVLVFSDGGNFDLSQRSDADFLDDLIAGYLAREINKEQAESDDDHSVTTRRYYTQPDGYNYVVNGINFSQGIDPFNRYTPFRSGQRALAGCTAIAMSEIMAYHGWPLQGVFKRYTTNTATPATVTVSYALTADERVGIIANNMAYCEAFYPNASECIANLIAETGYRLNQNYGTSVTLAFPSDVPAVFSAMGYTTSTYQNFSLTPIQNDIEVEEIPVFMAGWKNINDPLRINYDNGGHAYTIVGTYYKTNVGKIFIRLMNGTGGAYHDESYNTGTIQDWFNYQMFSISNNSNYVKDTSLPYDESIYPYRYDCKIVYDIKPNTNNTGCTNVNWRARSTYSY